MVSEILGIILGGGVVGYVLKKGAADPILEYRQVRMAISRDLVNYANIISNPGSGSQQRIDEAEQAFREHASTLQGTADNIPAYRLWAGLRLIPAREDVNEAKSKLIGLSNSLNTGNVSRNNQMRNDLKSLLGL